MLQLDCFLPILCEIAGARSVHLRVEHRGDGGSIGLIDRFHDASCGRDPRRGHSRQIPLLAEMDTVAKAGGRSWCSVAETAGPGVTALAVTGSAETEPVVLEPAVTGSAETEPEVVAELAVTGSAETEPEAAAEPAVARSAVIIPDGGSLHEKVQVQRIPCAVPGADWEMHNRDGETVWGFTRISPTLFTDVSLDFGGSGAGLQRSRLDAAGIVLHLVELLLGCIAVSASGSFSGSGTAPGGTASLNVEDGPLPPGGMVPAGATTPLFDPPFLGNSPAIREIRRRIVRLAESDITVLIEGESGTGKEVVARNIHGLGRRAAGPLVIANCMEVPHSLLQSELFGSVRGSFTGATRDRIGLVESAGGGTFFLDEIGEMPLSLQAGLLRVLQEREIRRIGESRRRRIDVRFVLATNRTLSELVAKGRFRSDLYYRINGVRLTIPPLRERREDIVPLAGHFLVNGSRRSRAPAPRIALETIRRLLSYHWPGNVRELANEMERAVAIYPEAVVIEPDMLSPHIGGSGRGRPARSVPGAATLPAAIERLERRMIEEALSHFKGNRTRAAAVLGITRQGLLKKLKRYGMTDGCTGPRVR
ncbi:MAG: sigma-54-dependent Fis family transcriptional regulator [bacterium]|nr:MAG: sigma-54-dependent Fis family transcriptional regulator [bacterium]